MLQFDALLSGGQIKEAAQYAAVTAVLRSSETVQKFQALPKADGGVPPILQYFSVLKEASKLNKLEAVELAKPAVQQVLRLACHWYDTYEATCESARSRRQKVQLFCDLVLLVIGTLRVGCVCRVSWICCASGGMRISWNRHRNLVT